MQITTLTTAFLIATAVSARSTFFASSPAIAPYEDSFEVPGENPLRHCEDPKDDILDLQSVDLDPNPPKA